MNAADSYELLIFVYVVGVIVSAFICENRDERGRFQLLKSVGFWLLSFAGIIYLLSKDFDDTPPTV